MTSNDTMKLICYLETTKYPEHYEPLQYLTHAQKAIEERIFYEIDRLYAHSMFKGEPIMHPEIYDKFYAMQTWSTK